ncbi:MAG TPA: cobalamin-independent methionine synthase II family protein [Dehalococcoidia bacterium]|nr:cobalamin-independent methionine synthase II family protein [Dehalococcoidia bacterium]
MKTGKDRILTTHVGSLPRPGDLAAMILSGAPSGTPEQQSAYESRVASAVAEAVDRQIAAGIDVVSDGEQGKIGFVNYVKDRLDGFGGQATLFQAADLIEFPGLGAGGAAAASAAQATAARAHGEQSPQPPNWTPACDSEISYRDHDAYRKDIANFKSALVGKQYEDAFICSITPGNVAQVLANQYYPSRTAYLRALGKAMGEEYRSIIDAGFLLQLDACDLAMDRHINFKNNSVAEFRDVIAENVEIINEASEGLPADRIRLHLCWGNYQGPHHRDVELRDIVDIVLRVRCGAVSFEAANPRHAHEWKVWRDVAIPPDLILIPGVIDTNSTYIEHPQVVADRIKDFASIVGPERVIAGTDCGFGTFVYLAVPEQLAYAKLKTLAEGAALASRDIF